jgi:hypothetical protein
VGINPAGGMQGLTNKAVKFKEVWANSDVLVQLTFLNSSNVATEPTSIQYRLDSLTRPQNIIGWTSVTPTGTEQILQIPGSIMVPTACWLGRENWQLTIEAVIPDANAASGSITVNKLLFLQLIAISFPY